MKEKVCITGASSGIGYALAIEFAKHGYDLVLTGRNKTALKELKKSIIQKYRRKVWIYIEDLSKEKGAASLYRNIKKDKLSIDIFINNAGCGYGGAFLRKSVDKDKEITMVNMYSLTVLTKLVARDMKKRGGGTIVNVASTGAYHPGPYISVYYASKAYVLSFSRAIKRELAPYQIQVSTLCPGAVATNFSKRAGKKENTFAMTPEYVARIAYQEIKKGKEIIIPKWYYKIFVKIPGSIVAHWIDNTIFTKKTYQKIGTKTHIFNLFAPIFRMFSK